MADRLIDSLKKFAQDKSGLREKEQRLAGTERRLIQAVGRLLSRVGYRVLPHSSSGDATARQSGGLHRRAARKRLQCPKCDRRFAHPLPMSRHMSATHGIKKGAKTVKAKRRRKPSA